MLRGRKIVSKIVHEQYENSATRRCQAEQMFENLIEIEHFASSLPQTVQLAMGDRAECSCCSLVPIAAAARTTKLVKICAKKSSLRIDM